MRSWLAQSEKVDLSGRLLVILVAGVVVLASCAPEAPASRAPDSEGSQRASGPPKVLRIDNRQESTWGMAIFAGNNAHQMESQLVFNAGLTVYNEKYEVMPRLAAKIPSIADGDWKVYPDGSMDVTWKLRPNLTWHDGAPLTAYDVAFGYQLMMDRELASSASGATKLVRGTTVQDLLTLVVHYTASYYDANVVNVNGMPPVPVHLMGDLYKTGDKQAFSSNSYWFGSFVGVGPYKLVQWQPGAFMEGAAFDGYVLGRPKIDRIFVRFTTDPNVSLAAFMAGELDILTHDLSATDREVLANRSGIKIDTWAQSTTGAIWQWRDPTAPWVGDERNTIALGIRQAFMHMMDRQAMADSFNPGGPGIAHLFVTPDDPVYKLVEARGLAKYPYDPARAIQLMANAGWTKGPDGMLRNSAGQTFRFELIDGDDLGVIVADYWRQGGIDSNSRDIPSSAVDRQRLKTEAQGARVGGAATAGTFMQQFTSKEVRAESNNWSGLNQGGYVNPDVDRMYERFLVEFDPNKRNAIDGDFFKFVNDQLLRQTWYYTGGAGAFTDRLTGPIPAKETVAIRTSNIHEWDLR